MSPRLDLFFCDQVSAYRVSANQSLNVCFWDQSSVARPAQHKTGYKHSHPPIKGKICFMNPQLESTQSWISFQLLLSYGAADFGLVGLIKL
jgi:hypothetical protein